MGQGRGMAQLFLDFFGETRTLLQGDGLTLLRRVTQNEDERKKEGETEREREKERERERNEEKQRTSCIPLPLSSCFSNRARDSAERMSDSQSAVSGAFSEDTAEESRGAPRCRGGDTEGDR